MQPDRWEQIASLYGAALELPASSRDAFLRANCGEDEGLRFEVESLLSMAAKPGLLDSAIRMEQLKPSAIIGGRFRIIRCAGQGGMGIVYEAEDLHLGGGVALKTIRPEIAFTANSAELFKREIQAAKRVTHPNACRIFDVGFHPSPGAPDARMFLTMEFLEGETLAHRLAAGPLTTAEAAPLIRQMAGALGAAHEAGVIHRDFKSGNVMLTSRERSARAVVMDFGLAGSFSSGDEGESPTGPRDLLGTPEYMAPEQLAGGRITPATDIYALGIVMYEMVTGRRPFHGATPLDAAVRRLQEPAESPRRIVPNLDARWERAILRCLERRPENRFQSTPELVSALEAGKAVNREGNRWKRLTLFAGMAIAALAAAAAIERAGRRPLPDEAAWQQITDFSDSATDPALSPDGRMLAFKRGGLWFMSSGQIYLKQMPDGQPVQLTHDAFAKMSPAFSPDGASIAYSVRRPGSADWEIWQAPVFPPGGEPRLALRNAEGLTWIDKRHILFSEIQDSIDVMSVVTSTESRAAIRNVYVPRRPQWMAHFSALSPDGKNVLIVEMDPVSSGRGFSNFSPCRLAPFDGSSEGRLAGPAPGHCIAAAWSPDGKWMYFSARVTDKFHLWRQRRDGTRLEQITYGPTGEEGLAIAADGRSAITSVGVDHNTVWLHDAKGERQISGEGSASTPKFAGDGSGVFYLSAADMWLADLRSGRTERVLPGVSVTDYAPSPDGEAIAYVTADNALWYARMDRRTAPRLLAREGRQPEFTRSGDVLFRSGSILYRVHPDGTDQRAVPGNPGDPARRSSYVSPDEKWAVRGADNGVVFAERRDGEYRAPLCDRCLVHWTMNGRFFWMSLRELNGEGITALFRLKEKTMLPRLARKGVKTGAELMKVPGAQIISSDAVSPAPDGSGYAFLKEESRWNLYRIPLP